MIQGLFVYVPLATLQTMQAQWIAALQAIAVGNQSYSIAGRAFTRANLREVNDTLAEIAYAIQLQSGTIQRTIYSDMSNS